MNKKILGSAVVYIGGEIVNKAIPFFLLPFLTAFLSPNDFGIVATYQAVLQVLLVIISLSMHASISVLFFKLDNPTFKKILASVFLISTLVAAFVSLFVYIFRYEAIQFLGVDNVWVLLLPIIVLFQAFCQFHLVLYQVRKMQTQYIIFQISNTVLNVSLSVFLIAYWNVGLEGRLAGIAIAAICFGLWAFFNLKRNNFFDFSLSQENFSVPLRFSVPLVPHSLSSWIKTSIDRILLMSFFGGAIVGEYSVMYQLASILSVVFMAANKALIPYLFSYMKQNINDWNSVVLWCKRIAGVITLTGISFLISVPYIFEAVVKGDYVFSSSVISLLIVGFMLQGFYLLQVNFLMYNEKTRIVAKVAVINSILHLAIAIPMVFCFGAFGAALTNVLSWGCLLVLTFFYGSKDNAYPWCREV